MLFPIFMIPSCWSYCSCTFRISTSTCKLIPSRFFEVLRVVTYGFQCLGRLQRIFSMLSKLSKVLPNDPNSFKIVWNWLNMAWMCFRCLAWWITHIHALTSSTCLFCLHLILHMWQLGCPTFPLLPWMHVLSCILHQTKHTLTILSFGVK